MSDEILTVALRNALTEVKNAYTDLDWSFILTDSGTVITSDETNTDPRISKAAEAFKSVAERASIIGGLENMFIYGDKGKVYVCRINNVHLIAGLTKNADLAYFRTLTGTLLPAIIKVVDSLASSTLTPSPLKPTSFNSYSPAKPALTEPAYPELKTDEEQPIVMEDELLPEDNKKELDANEVNEPEESTSEKTEDVPSQQLIVDRFSGFMVKADTVQIDSEVLKRWSTLMGNSQIKEVELETFGNKTMRCKVKVINDPKLEGRGFIRIPEKTCQSLEIRRGELVRVKPAVNDSEGSE